MNSNEPEYCREKIIEIINQIDDVKYLQYIYSFAKPMLDKQKGYKNNK